MVDAEDQHARRARLVAIKRAIAAGSYETPDKLSAALDSLLDMLEDRHPNARPAPGNKRPPAV